MKKKICDYLSRPENLFTEFSILFFGLGYALGYVVGVI